MREGDRQGRKRCGWCDLNSPEYVRYHDEQWGVPVYDDRLLFEMLILEGMQAGLSWISILKKRDNFLAAFDNFEIATVAAYGEEKVQSLMQDAGIIRNRLKINSAITNAQVTLKIIEEFGSLSSYLWSWVENQPIQNSYTTYKEMPAETELSKNLSKDLKKRGMRFVGPVIIYSLMQAVGMVNDHETGCFRHGEVADLSA